MSEFSIYDMIEVNKYVIAYFPWQLCYAIFCQKQLNFEWVEKMEKTALFFDDNSCHTHGVPSNTKGKAKVLCIRLGMA